MWEYTGWPSFISDEHDLEDQINKYYDEVDEWERNQHLVHPQMNRFEMLRDTDKLKEVDIKEESTQLTPDHFRELVKEGEKMRNGFQKAQEAAQGFADALEAFGQSITRRPRP